MKKLVFILFVMLSIQLAAQQSVNDYKYIVLPSKFDFQTSADSYQINSLTKFLFEKYGFTVYYDTDEKPLDLKLDVCKALKVDLNHNSTMFKTEIIIELYDCNNNLVYQSVEGFSKDKNIKNAYHETIREAFVSFETLNYKYNPTLEDNNAKVDQTTTSNIENSIGLNEKRVYLMNENVIYELIRNNDQYILQEKMSNKIIARLIKSFQDPYYHYQEEKEKGFGSFNENGSLIIEVISVNGLRKVKSYKRLD